jgi:hypothetical protein
VRSALQLRADSANHLTQVEEDGHAKKAAVAQLRSESANLCTKRDAQNWDVSPNMETEHDARPTASGVVAPRPPDPEHAHLVPRPPSPAAQPTPQGAAPTAPAAVEPPPEPSPEELEAELDAWRALVGLAPAARASSHCKSHDGPLPPAQRDHELPRERGLKIRFGLPRKQPHGRVV